MKTLLHTYAENLQQLGHIAGLLSGDLKDRAGGPVRLLFELQQDDNGKHLIVVTQQPSLPDVRATIGIPLKSADDARYRYYCEGGPLDGSWFERKLRIVDRLEIGDNNPGAYVLADAGRLIWQP